MILSILKANAEISRLTCELAELTKERDALKAQVASVSDLVDAAAKTEAASAAAVAEAEQRMADVINDCARKVAEAKAESEQVASRRALEIVASQGVPSDQPPKTEQPKKPQLTGLARAIAAHRN